MNQTVQRMLWVLAERRRIIAGLPPAEGTQLTAGPLQRLLLPAPTTTAAFLGSAPTWFIAGIWATHTVVRGDLYQVDARPQQIALARAALLTALLPASLSEQDRAALDRRTRKALQAALTGRLWDVAVWATQYGASATAQRIYAELRTDALGTAMQVRVTRCSHMNDELVVGNWALPDPREPATPLVLYVHSVGTGEGVFVLSTAHPTAALAVQAMLPPHGCMQQHVRSSPLRERQLTDQRHARRPRLPWRRWVPAGRRAAMDGRLADASLSPPGLADEPAMLEDSSHGSDSSDSGAPMQRQTLLQSTAGFAHGPPLLAFPTATAEHYIPHSSASAAAEHAPATTERSSSTALL